MAISRSVLGWLFNDDFNRSDGAPGSNWNVIVATVAIATNRLRASTALAKARVTAVSDANEMVMQCNVVVNSSAAGGPLFRTQSTGNGYYVQFNSGNVATIFRYAAPSGFTSIVTTGAFTYTGGVAFAFKSWTKTSFQRAYLGSAPVTISGTDATLNANNGTAGVMLNNTGNVEIDDLWLYTSNNVIMTGLPSGYKVRVGALTATESGGTATLDLLSTVCPFALVEVLDGSNNVIDTLAPTGGGAPDGGYGGDTYDFSVVPPDAPDIEVPASDGQVFDRLIDITVEDVSDTGDGDPEDTEYKVEHEASTGAGWTTLIDWNSERVFTDVDISAFADGDDHRLRAFARKDGTSSAGAVRTFEVLHSEDPPTTPTLEWVHYADRWLGFYGSEFDHPVEGATVAGSEWQIDEFGGDFSSPVAETTRSAVRYRLAFNDDPLELLTADTDYIARVRYEDDQGNLSEWSASVRGKTSRRSTASGGVEIYEEDLTGGERHGIYGLMSGTDPLNFGNTAPGTRWPAYLEVDPPMPSDDDDWSYRVIKDTKCRWVAFTPDPLMLESTRPDAQSSWPDWALFLRGTIDEIGTLMGVFGIRDGASGGGSTVLGSIRVEADGDIQLSGNRVFGFLANQIIGEAEEGKFSLTLAYKYDDDPDPRGRFWVNGVLFYTGAALAGHATGLGWLEVGYDALNTPAVGGSPDTWHGTISEMALWWNEDLDYLDADDLPAILALPAEPTQAQILAAAPTIYWRMQNPKPPATPTVS